MKKLSAIIVALTLILSSAFWGCNGVTSPSQDCQPLGAPPCTNPCSIDLAFNCDPNTDPLVVSDGATISVAVMYTSGPNSGYEYGSTQTATYGDDFGTYGQQYMTVTVPCDQCISLNVTIDDPNDSRCGTCYRRNIRYPSRMRHPRRIALAKPSSVALSIKDACPYQLVRTVAETW